MALQDTLIFETIAPEEVLKRAIKFEHSKLATMAFQKTNAATVAGTSTNYNSGEKSKQEPLDMDVHLTRGFEILSGNGENLQELPET